MRDTQRRENKQPLFFRFRTIRFLPSSDRNALAKQVEELYDVCKMAGVSAWHSSECVQGLNLSLMSPWVRSFRDDRGIDQAISIIKSSPYSGSDAVVAVGAAHFLKRDLNNAIKKEWRLFWNTIWDTGVAVLLKPKGYDVAALLLQHSLENSPSSLHFSQSHWVTQKIIESNGFKKAFANLENNIQENPEMYAVNGSVDMDFQDSRDTDLYYGIGKCTLTYTCTRFQSSVRIKFSIEDTYNFDHIRSISGHVKKIVVLNHELGNFANDAGLLSQADGVISVYQIYVNFEKTIQLGGLYQ